MAKNFDLPPGFRLNTDMPNRGTGSHYGWGYNGELSPVETWRPIKIYRAPNATFEITEGYYVSDRGNILSTRFSEKRYILKPDASTEYARVKLLCQDGKRRWFQVHRLVLDNWLDCPDVVYKLLKFVNHRDGDKLNNIITNLEYICHAENVNHYWDVIRPLIEKQSA